jgi:hypothetical protein
LPHYGFDPATGLWRHRADDPRPPLRLSDLSFIADGILAPQHTRAAGGEQVLPGQLEEARRILESLPGVVDDGPTGMAADFEALRWFPLPLASLSQLQRRTREGHRRQQA